MGFPLPLPPQEVAIGRREANDLQLGSDSIWGHYGVIRRARDRGIKILDLAARKGAAVNEARVDHIALADGDSITRGEVRLRFSTFVGKNIMRSYRIGRGENVDILIDESSVGRYHADLVLTKDGGYLWIDRQSANGSYRCKNSQWVPLIKDVVAADEPIRLGRVETTVAALLEKAGLAAGKREPQDGGMERDSFGMPRPKR